MNNTDINKDGIYDAINIMEDNGMITENQFDKTFYIIEEYLLDNNLFIKDEGYSAQDFVRLYGEEIMEELSKIS